VHRIHYRFGLVLGLILATVAFQLAAPEGDGARFIAVTLQAAVLVAAVTAWSRRPIWRARSRSPRHWWASCTW
jgi:hypothetical protein